VSIPAGSSRDIALLSDATASLVIKATRDIIPQRTVLGARGATSTYGRP
jgi:hypothetical protein